jgi:A/G-specific adenine glycosylase
MPRRRPIAARSSADSDEVSESESGYGGVLQQLVLQWYEGNGRRLPWRETQDAYRIWLSEIMLQQTTVAAVIPYFQRFIVRFPTVDVLAAADVEEVLRHWEGLGYYSRARNLHRAAGVICGEHGGEFPRSLTALQALPGIGRYTAGAIAAFAWDLPAPILEANTERLYARLTALTEPSDSTSGRKKLWAFAESIVPQRRAGDFNQALMDLGSRVCTPVAPHCGECPLAALCRARQEGRAEQFPVRRPRAAVTELSELAVVLERGGQVLLRQRGLSERWAGMHDFPRFELSPELGREIPSMEWSSQCGGKREKVQRGPRSRSLFTADGELLPEALQPLIERSTGLRAGALLGTLQTVYSVTRYRVSLMVVRCATADQGTQPASGWCWHPLKSLDELPLPTTARKIVNWLQSGAE